MKKRVIFAAALTLTMCAGWSFSKSFTTESKLSELQIENVEAIASGEDHSGKKCYSNGSYNIKKPEALVCGDPCKYLPWEMAWFPTTSECLPSKEDPEY